jgi:hypothetical protein
LATLSSGDGFNNLDAIALAKAMRVVLGARNNAIVSRNRDTAPGRTQELQHRADG